MQKKFAVEASSEPNEVKSRMNWILIFRASWVNILNVWEYIQIVRIGKHANTIKIHLTSNLHLTELTMLRRYQYIDENEWNCALKSSVLNVWDRNKTSFHLNSLIDWFS